jgi:hypothetical protein
VGQEREKALGSTCILFFSNLPGRTQQKVKPACSFILLEGRPNNAKVLRTDWTKRRDREAEVSKKQLDRSVNWLKLTVSIHCLASRESKRQTREKRRRKRKKKKQREF